jgi:hypothetical protein
MQGRASPPAFQRWIVRARHFARRLQNFSVASIASQRAMRDAAGTGPRVDTVIGPWRKSGVSPAGKSRTEQDGQPLQLCRHPAFQSLLDELRRLEQIRIHAGFGHGAGNRLKSVRDEIREVCHAGKTGTSACAGV